MHYRLVRCSLGTVWVVAVVVVLAVWVVAVRVVAEVVAVVADPNLNRHHHPRLVVQCA